MFAVTGIAKAGRRDLPERLRICHEARVDAPHADAGVVDEDVHAAEAA
jgi:hypothetical protein